MQSTVVTGLESLSHWREALERKLAALGRVMREQELDTDADIARLAKLRERLSSERIIVAFVAEFSRGKSELINAIFFADAGRRILPATPGRTTMCPVELHHDEGSAPMLSLLPIETRLQGLALVELRQRQHLWQQVPLDANNPEALARALQEVTRTQPVTVEKATALGLWSEEDELERPPRAQDGAVEVPAWRHAVINYPHPLLRRGLVVIDTPGLNAIGAEPELTLGLLPSAHATVFLLAADTGVTKSDLSVWREHLSGSSLERFVVLNKIDTLSDPMATAGEVQAQIESQREVTARTLDMPLSRIYPLSARDALAARVAGDNAELERSRLPVLEHALATELMPRQREILAAAVREVVDTLRRSAQRQLGERRRLGAEQLLELRGLRGKSGGKLRLMQQRLLQEATDFEQCTVRLGALRAVQTRQLAAALALLSSDALRIEVTAMQSAFSGRPLMLGAAKAFATMCARLRAAIGRAAAQADEMRQMLDASAQRLNADFAFAFNVSRPPSLERFVEELARTERAYSQYLSVTQAWRLSAPTFREQFRRLLLSKLRVVFENAAADIELWSKSVLGPMDQQLRERRQAFQRRREALERVEGASDELESRISEVETGEQRFVAQWHHVEALVADTLDVARATDVLPESASTEPQRDAA